MKEHPIYEGHSWPERCSQTKHLVCRSVSHRLSIPQNLVEEVYAALFREALADLSKGNEVVLAPFGKFVFTSSRHELDAKLYEVKQLNFERTGELKAVIARVRKRENGFEQ